MTTKHYVDGSLVSDHGSFQIGNGSVLDSVHMNGIEVWHRQVPFDGMEMTNPNATYSTEVSGIAIGMRGLSSVYQGKTYANRIQVWTKDSVGSGWATGTILVDKNGYCTGSSVRNGYGLTTSGGLIRAYNNGYPTSGGVAISSTGSASGSSSRTYGSITIHITTSGGSFRIGLTYGSVVYAAYKTMHNFTYWYDV